MYYRQVVQLAGFALHKLAHKSNVLRIFMFCTRTNVNLRPSLGKLLNMGEREKEID
jgi:hypothetical protein